MAAATLLLANLTNGSDSGCNVHHHRYTAKVIFSCFYIILLVFGSCGNILALCVTFQRGKKKINSTDLYLINLALSDALFTLALPGRIAYYLLEFNWPFGDVFCRVTAFIFYMNTYVGIYFMTCVSVDRYIAVVRSRCLGKFRRVSRVKYICGVVWLLVFIQTMPLLMRPMTKVMGDKLTCMEYFNFEEIPKLPIILLGACMVGFLLPVGIILVCYVRINLKLCRTAKENPLTDKNGHHRKAVTVIVVVLLAVVICFSPYHVNIIQFMIRKILYQPSCLEQKAFKMSLQVTVAMMNMNCCIDPIIYFFAFRGYKRRLLRIFKNSGSTLSSSTAKTPSESNSNSHNQGACSLSI
ncbi:PREDICTED: G-protein coupled receptor 183-like [Crocodylus porosus]|uniref:G-protein coupled receptor 183-like n=1 Tax=Crocodylus porosus TaxID=8502 RepID=UPI00093B7A12|nr:PREDICTED: G-protein coupled receptor 183-like [Crocodylus porosus]XP_019385257.1 PREDICTED: G-protein coupled receptor 183-like [Crocodylus porosus]